MKKKIKNPNASISTRGVKHGSQDRAGQQATGFLFQGCSCVLQLPFTQLPQLLDTKPSLSAFHWLSSPLGRKGRGEKEQDSEGKQSKYGATLRVNQTCCLPPLKFPLFPLQGGRERDKRKRCLREKSPSRATKFYSRYNFLCAGKLLQREGKRGSVQTGRHDFH